MVQGVKPFSTCDTVVFLQLYLSVCSCDILILKSKWDVDKLGYVCFQYTYTVMDTYFGYSLKLWWLSKPDLPIWIANLEHNFQRQAWNKDFVLVSFVQWFLVSISACLSLWFQLRAPEISWNGTLHLGQCACVSIPPMLPGNLGFVCTEIKMSMHAGGLFYILIVFVTHVYCACC